MVCVGGTNKEDYEKPEKSHIQKTSVNWWGGEGGVRGLELGRRKEGFKEHCACCKDQHVGLFHEEI